VGDAGAEDAASAFAAALAASNDWDVATFDYLPAGSAVVRHLVPALSRRGLRTFVRERGTNPCIALDASWSGYYASRSRRLKKAVNLAANRLARTGTIRIEHVAGADVDDATFARALDDVCEVSSRSWKRGTGTTLEQPGPAAFIRQLSGLARARGWLSIWLLYRDGRALATEYQLAANGHVYALRADFVAESDDVSPGTHLFRTLLESSFGRGLARYHLGPGDNPYKRRWSDGGTPMQRAIVYNRTWRGLFERLKEEAARPALRAVRDRFRRGHAGPPAPGDEASEP
jgi:CelD/BcsL family acetyltransferase involved in cellulose biosynthesis